MMDSFSLSLAADRPALISGRDNTVDVLLRVQAPDPPASGLPARPHLNLSIVIDRSGSMDGQPLHEAKLCAAFIVDKLKSTDRVSVVAYDNTVDVYAPSQKVRHKNLLKAAIAGIHSAGSTNLHGGWLRGAEETAGHLAPGSVSRVLLLSDGQANVGIVDAQEIASQCAQLASKGVSTSTYGLGTGFNEELMIAMARSGQGNSYYSDSAESLLERFQEEFSLLSSLCARKVRLHLNLLPGVRCEMLNLYEALANGAWQMPDLVYDGEVWAALRLTVDASILPPMGEVLALVEASLTCHDLSGAACQIPAVWLPLPVVSKADFQTIPLDESVVRRIGEAEAAKLQALAGHAAREGDWAEVARLLATVRRMAVDNPFLGQVVLELEKLASQRDNARFSKEASFAASNMSSSVRSKKESLTGVTDSSAPAHLRRKVRQGAAGSSASQPATETYPLDFVDNRPIILIEGRRVIVDTASALSIGDGAEFQVAGQTFCFHAQQGITPGKLSGWMNTRIDALLGTDCLSHFAMTIDLPHDAVTIASRGNVAAQGIELPAKWLLGTPVLEFSAAGVRGRGIFSTAAKLCYMPRSAIGAVTSLRRTTDYHPLIGEFETEVYPISLEIGGHIFDACCGVLPDQLRAMLVQMTGIDWLIGSDLLREGVITFDLRQKLVTAVWN